MNEDNTTTWRRLKLYMWCEMRKIREQSESPSRMAEENIHNIGGQEGGGEKKMKKKTPAKTEKKIMPGNWKGM